LRTLRASRIAPVINGTGVVIHTNLGRAPLGRDAIAALTQAGERYSTLEYGLLEGSRGGRASYLEKGLALLCGAEAATVVNNNAAALVLILRHFCRDTKTDVVISRGELVQIGGGFRIPDLLEASGARLREVGTTNQTTIADYGKALTRATALILKVHRSNFFMEGFVESPPTEALAALARRKRVPFVEDLGSGAVVEMQLAEGVEHEPTPAELLRQGVDLVCFSGDKLFGGPQAGIIAGRQRLVSALKREPFFRALRCDKLALTALQATADAYLRGEPALPVLDMLKMPIDALRARAEHIMAAVSGGALAVRIGTARSRIGGGTLPRSLLDSIALDLTHVALAPQPLAAALRDQPLPVIGYVARNTVRIDLRTVFPSQDEALIGALRAVSRA
jgi:L-seryl-tRNA(Ser) seleniumtransferase